MEALDAEMEAVKPEFEAYDEDADKSGELHDALEEKAGRHTRKSLSSSKVLLKGGFR